MDRNDAGNPFEKGDPLKDENFSKYWFRILWITVLLLLLIFGAFHFFHHPR